MIFDSKTFNIKATIHEDVTAYGNRFVIQCEDEEDNDHSWLRELKGKDLVITCIASELPKKDYIEEKHTGLRWPTNSHQRTTK